VNKKQIAHEGAVMMQSNILGQNTKSVLLWVHYTINSILTKASTASIRVIIYGGKCWTQICAWSGSLIAKMHSTHSKGAKLINYPDECGQKYLASMRSFVNREKAYPKIIILFRISREPV
jgi:hypothetical protein